jgi:hypothetical protein
MKILICPKGRFHLSDEQVMYFFHSVGIWEAAKTEEGDYVFLDGNGDARLFDTNTERVRTDAILIDLVESDSESDLEVVELPEGVMALIEANDGGETIYVEERGRDQ